MANVTKQDIERVELLLNKFLDWAGVDDDTKGSVEVITLDDDGVTVDDMYDAINVLVGIKMAIDDGRLKDL